MRNESCGCVAIFTSYSFESCRHLGCFLGVLSLVCIVGNASLNACRFLSILIDLRMYSLRFADGFVGWELLKSVRLRLMLSSAWFKRIGLTWRLSDWPVVGELFGVPGVPCSSLIEASTEPFSPRIVSSEPNKFSGLRIKSFPREADHGEIIKFITDSGLPSTSKDSILIGDNGVVMINNLENSLCTKLITTIHGKSFY